MSIKTNYQESQVINAMNPGGVAMAAWTPYVGTISAVTDAEAGTVTENTTTLGLTRQACSFGTEAAGSGATAGGQARKNTAIINMGTATAAGTIAYVGVWDAESAGNLRYVIDNVDKTVAIGDPVTFPIGALELAEL